MTDNEIAETAAANVYGIFRHAPKPVLPPPRSRRDWEADLVIAVFAIGLLAVGFVTGCAYGRKIEAQRALEDITAERAENAAAEKARWEYIRSMDDADLLAYCRANTDR